MLRVQLKLEITPQIWIFRAEKGCTFDTFCITGCVEAKTLLKQPGVFALCRVLTIWLTRSFKSGLKKNGIRDPGGSDRPFELYDDYLKALPKKNGWETTRGLAEHMGVSNATVNLLHLDRNLGLGYLIIWLNRTKQNQRCISTSRRLSSVLQPQPPISAQNSYRRWQVVSVRQHELEIGMSETSQEPDFNHVQEKVMPYVCRRCESLIHWQLPPTNRAIDWHIYYIE